MGFDFIRTFKHTALLSFVALIGKQRFQCPFFCRKAGRGLLALSAIPSRMKLLLDIQEPCTTTWNSTLSWISNLFLAILSIVCLRDESTISLPRACDYTEMLQNITALNKEALRKVGAMNSEGLFKYRYFLSRKDEDPRVASYDGGRVPTPETQLHMKNPLHKRRGSQTDNITLKDHEVLVHFHWVGVNSEHDEDIWVLKPPNDDAVMTHAQLLGDMIHREIVEVVAVLG